MTDSPEPQKRRLIADTETPTVEIVLSDGLGRVVARASSKLDIALDPGLYKLRFRVGEHVQDEVMELQPGTEPFHYQTPRLPFETVVPINRRGRPPSSNARHATTLSQSTPEAHGVGSELLVFVDTPGTELPPALDILTPEIGFLTRIEQTSGSGTFAGGLLSLDPGNYVLRWQGLEQTVTTCAGWQTQVYLRCEDDEKQPDLSEAAIVMRRTGVAFDPDDPGFRSAEVARNSLRSHRWRAADDPDLMALLLDPQFDNPILGILVAHLMLLADPIDHKLLQSVVRSVERLVPGHPDLASLRYVLNDPRAQEASFLVPPMLRSSWQQIIERAGDALTAVPSRSYSARIPGSLRGDSAWLSWTTPPAAEADADGEGFSVGDVLRLLDLIRAGEVPQRVLNGLTPIERALLFYAQSLLGQIGVAQMLTRVLDDSRQLGSMMQLVRKVLPSTIEQSALEMIRTVARNPQELVAMTGLPVASLREATISLLRKLRAAQEPGTLSAWADLLPGAMRAVTNALRFTNERK